MKSDVKYISDLESISIKRSIRQLRESVNTSNEEAIKINIYKKNNPSQFKSLINNNYNFSREKSNFYEWLEWDTNKFRDDVNDIGAYILDNLSVSFYGALEWKNKIISEKSITPEYVLGGIHRPEIYQKLHSPTRTISEPCFVCMGWGSDIYGHLIIEILPRLMVAFTEFHPYCPEIKFLIDKVSPQWFINLINKLGIEKNKIEFYDSRIEKIKLKKAVLINQLISKEFHPISSKYFYEIVKILKINTDSKIDNIFLTRAFLGNSLRGSFCPNEVEIARIASQEFGYTIVPPETLPFEEQVRLFLNAKKIVGISGSAIHTSIFSQNTPKIGSIEPNNILQHKIAKLKGQRIGYLNFEPGYRQVINSDKFKFFLEEIDEEKKERKFFMSKNDLKISEIKTRISTSLDTNDFLDKELINENYIQNPGCILVHRSGLGDVKNTNALNSGPAWENHPIEGFMLFLNEELKDKILYRYYNYEGEWSDFSENGEYIGSIGNGKYICGFSVEVKNMWKNEYSVDISAKFSDGFIEKHPMNLMCYSRTKSPLTSIQIAFYRSISI